MFYDRDAELIYFTAETKTELTPKAPIPSPESPLVLPGEPNPLNKPGLIPIFQYISTVYQQYLKDEVNIGYLTTQVTTASGTSPVPNAKVTISKPLGKDIFISQVAFTDETGKTPPVPLPTRSVERSQTPEYPVPYTIWNLIIEAPGYYDIIVYDIPIFPGVTTTQSFDLTPTNMTCPTKEIYASVVKEGVYY